jgi:fused signal recognition particle receptor
MAFSKLQNSLKKTREGVFGKVSRLLTAKRKIDDDFLEQLEEILITGDVGVETSMYLIEKIEKRAKSDKFIDDTELENLIKDEIKNALLPVESISDKQDLQVVLVVGVNGTGKTTSIAKLASKYKNEGKSVLLAAADTFRAAAIEQLDIWAEKVGCDIIKHSSGSDPSAVVFDAITAAQSRSVDFLIIDTAGRLHTKTNLMNELNKIFRVIQNKIPEAPHEVILVLDASTGQNAINQAKEFKNVAQVDSICLTKLDGTAKGGVVLGINKELEIPVKYIGVGEKIDDLEIFNREIFVEGLFSKE